MKKRFIRPVLLTIFVLYLFLGVVPPATAGVGSVTYTLCAKEENIEVCLDVTHIKDIGMGYQESKIRACHLLKERVKASKSHTK
ncbi:MAG: hypothetical protein RLZZ223_251 [Candidatus Parcubacteria bacterium]|jgi:hypothetical protein